MSTRPGDPSIVALPGEPLAAWFAAPRVEGALRVRRFECASHGDLVSGRAWFPAQSPRALVLALHPLGGRAEAPPVVAAARGWAERGLATAAIDLPLHGERHNAKLSRRAVAAAAPAHADHALWRGLLSQAVRDLARALDALATLGPLGRVACVAFAGAAPIAAAFASLDARVSAAFALDAPGEDAAGLQRLVRPEDLQV